MAFVIKDLNPAKDMAPTEYRIPSFQLYWYTLQQMHVLYISISFISISSLSNQILNPIIRNIFL